MVPNQIKALQTFILIATISAFEMPMTVPSFGKRITMVPGISMVQGITMEEWFVIKWVWGHADVQLDRDHVGVRERRAAHDHPLNWDTRSQTSQQFERIFMIKSPFLMLNFLGI